MNIQLSPLTKTDKNWCISALQHKYPEPHEQHQAENSPPDEMFRFEKIMK